MEKEAKDAIKYVIKAIAVLLTIGLGGTKGCNYYYNNRVLTTSAHKTISRAVGLAGHVEYSVFNDGSKEIRIYPVMGTRNQTSESYQDLNGDGKIDRIRKNASEWKMHHLTSILVRDQDYNSHKEEFNKADSLLKKLQEENKQ